MAAAAAVHSLPRLVTWRTVACLACTHLAWATVNAVFCLFIASVWLLFCGLATLEIGRLACGEGCAVVTAAYKVISVAVGVNLVLVFPFTGLLTTTLMMARARAAAATHIEATKEPAPETSSYAAVRDLLCDSLALGLLASWAFTLLMPIAVLVKGDSPVMGSRRERMGSVIYHVGALGTVMVNCFVSCPIMTVKIWRAWGMAMAWRRDMLCDVDMWYVVETKP